MRRAIALARDYAHRRAQFGSVLANKPLHTDTLAGIQAEYEAAFHLAFRTVELLGREEAGEIAEGEAELLRVLTPLAKLMTGKQAVEIASEAVEAFGGAGYIEDTGLPRLLRDAQTLPIWEGTTNVLSLDVLRAMANSNVPGGTLGAIEAEVQRATTNVSDEGLKRAAHAAREALSHAKAWAAEAFQSDRMRLEAGARRFAQTLGRSLELALLVEHAQWSLVHERDGRARAAAMRFVRHGVDRIGETELADGALGRDEPIGV
jgi:hypothetical protein